MALNFPSSPNTNDTFTSGGITWTYNGSSWTTNRVESSFDSLSDVNLTGAANNDLLYRSGGSWIDTAGQLTWDGSTLLATAGTISGASVVALSNTLEVQGSFPFLQLNQTDGGTNEKKWVWIYDNTALEMRAVNDASSAYSQAFVMSRSGYAISSLTFGNATDNPTYTFSGTGLTTVGGALSVTGQIRASGGSAGAPAYSFSSDSNSGMFGNNAGEIYIVSDGTARLTVNSSGATVNGSLSASSVVATSSVMEIQGSFPFLQLNQTDGGTNEKRWVWIADGTAMELRAVNDASDAYTNAFTFTRSAQNVSNLTFGNATSNPTYTFAGTGAISGVGSGLTSLNASNISSGTLDDARLSSNVVLENVSNTFTVSPRVSNTLPWVGLDENDQAADERWWLWLASGKVMSLRAYDDAISSSTVIMSATRGTGTAITNVTLGNATNNPTYTFAGTGTATFGGRIAAPAGTAASPSIYFGDTGTGFYRATTADTISVGINGNQRVLFDNSGITMGTGKFFGPGGSAAAPTYSFVSDSNSGMYSNNSGTIYLVSDGTARLYVDSTGANVVGTLEADAITINSNPVLFKRVASGTATNQWVRIAKRESQGGRGTSIIRVYSSGGSQTPQLLELFWDVDWTASTNSLDIKHNALAYVTSIKSTKNSTTAAYLEIYVTGTSVNLDVEVQEIGYGVASAASFETSFTAYTDDVVITDSHLKEFTRNNGATRISSTGVLTTQSHIYPEGQTVGRIQAVTGSYGSIEVSGADGSIGTWAGYSIDGEGIFMWSPADDRGGLYATTPSWGGDWYVQLNRNNLGEVDLYFNGTPKLTTSSAGVTVAGSVTTDAIIGTQPTDLNALNTSSRNTEIFSSGFQPTNAPGGANYYSGIYFRHNLSSDYGTQLTTGASGGEPFLFLRSKVNGTWGSYREVYHAGNFTPGNYLPLAGGTLTGGLSGTTASFSSTVSGSSLSGSYIGVNNTTSTNGYGLSLYNGPVAGTPTYGIMFQGTGTFGTHGSVTGDWATYFTMNNTANRGWIFRDVSTPANVASISNTGIITSAGATINGALTVQINGTTTMPLRVYNAQASVVANTSIHLGYPTEGYGWRITSNNNPSSTYAGNLQFTRGVGTSTYTVAGYFDNSSNLFLNASAVIGTGFRYYMDGGSSIGIGYNGTGTYSPVQIYGSKSSYGGFYDNYSAVNMMWDSSGNGGEYRSAWRTYWSTTNACMGIDGSTTSSSYSMYVSGGIYATGDVVAFSDERKKENIVTVDNALEKLNKLRGVYYNKIGEEKRSVGVIAQEVEKILPEVVTHSMVSDDNGEERDEYGVDYGKMVGLLIEAVKELSAEVKMLKEKK